MQKHQQGWHAWRRRRSSHVDNPVVGPVALIQHALARLQQNQKYTVCKQNMIDITPPVELWPALFLLLMLLGGLRRNSCLHGRRTATVAIAATDVVIAAAVLRLVLLLSPEWIPTTKDIMLFQVVLRDSSSDRGPHQQRRTREAARTTTAAQQRRRICVGSRVLPSGVSTAAALCLRYQAFSGACQLNILVARGSRSMLGACRQSYGL